MKLNYELIKDILEEHGKEGAKTSHSPVPCRYAHPESNMGEYFTPYSHYHMLFSNEYMSGFVYLDEGVNDVSSDQLFHMCFKGLTPKGKEVLNIMQNDVVWKKIKDDVIKMGDKGIDQIQNLALAI